MDRPRGPTPGSPKGNRALISLPGKKADSPTQEAWVTTGDHPARTETREAPGVPKVLAFGGLATQE